MQVNPNPNIGSSQTNNNGGLPLSPKTIITRSETNPYPTTYVQADPTTFKQVVQMLTGSPETVKKITDPTQFSNNKNSTQISRIPPKKQSFKLYERRANIRNGLMISPSGFFFRKPEILSPSILDFPSLMLSPVTPLKTEDYFNKSSSSSLENSPEEEKAIAEKKFYLHPSPSTTTPRRAEPPKLLPLFPVTSPRISDSSM